MRDTKDIVPFAPTAASIAILERIAAPAGSPLPFPRLLLVLAHPDDEVLALGGRLERLATSRILHVTDGTPTDGADARHHGFTSLEAYRAARQGELTCALRHAGLSESLVAPFNEAFPLPVPDQSAALHLAALTNAVAAAISAFAPEAVLTHPYEGGHPDHDACAFIVHTALRLLSASSTYNRDRTQEPVVIESPFYHAGSQGGMQTGCFLETVPSPAIRICELSPPEQANKRARLACFASQAETLAQFAVEREFFRLAPTYNFAAPPHPGRLFYEQFPWGMSGDHFRELASAALEQLGLSQEACTESPAAAHGPLPA